MRTNLVALGELADFINGAAFKPEDWGESGLPIIRIQNLTDPGKPFNYTERPVPRKLVVEPGDLLVSWSATLGVFQWEGPRGLLNQHIFRVLPDSSVVDRGYLKHALGRAIVEMERHLHGATMKHVNRGEFLGTKIPLPPLEEQRRIAAILDKTAWLHGQALDQLNKAKELLASLFVETVGDPLQNPRSWSTIPLAEAVQTGTDVTYGIVQAGEEFLGGIPYIRTGDIVNGEIVTSSLRHTDPSIASRFVRSTVRTGEIVMSIRATVGTTAMVPACLDGANLNQGTARIAPGERTNGLYLLQYLRMPSTQAWIQRQVKGATFREITLARLRELPVLLPPMAVQEAFASRASIVYSTIESTKALTARAQSLSLSLSNQLLG